MSDERMIRAENLKLLKKRLVKNNKEFGELMGWTGAYVGKLCERKTPFTEKTARLIEERNELPKGWLDEVHMGSEEARRATSAKGAIRGADAAPLDAIRSKLGGNISYLRTDSSDPGPLTLREHVPAAKSHGLAPVVEWASLGVGLYKEDMELGAAAYIAAPEDSPPDTKWYIVDTDMPRFRIKRGNKVAIARLDSADGCADGDLNLFMTASGAYFLGEFRRLLVGYEAIPDTGLPLDSERHGVKVVGEWWSTSR